MRNFYHLLYCLEVPIDSTSSSAEERPPKVPIRREKSNSKNDFESETLSAVGN